MLSLMGIQARFWCFVLRAMGYITEQKPLITKYKQQLGCFVLRATRQKPVCRRARKILIRRTFVRPAGRSGGFKGIRWGIFASPELSLTPGGRLYTQVEIAFFVFFAAMPVCRRPVKF